MTSNRWGALFGAVAAVAILVAVVAMGGDTPDGDAPSSDWVSYIQDHDTLLLARAYVFTLVALAIVAFYAFGVRPKLGESEPTDRSLGQFGAGATLMGAVFMAAGGLIGAAAAGAYKFGDVPVDPGLSATLDNFVYGFILVAGALSLGVLMLVVAIQTQRRKVFPQWVLWLSVAGVIGMAASVIFLPFVLLPIWLLGMSVALFRE